MPPKRKRITSNGRKLKQLKSTANESANRDGDAAMNSRSDDSTTIIARDKTVVTIGAIGSNAVNQNITNYFAAGEAKIAAEPYDFRSIIDSKLSDIKMESFGREWLYHRMYEWLMASVPPQLQSHAQQQPKSLPPKVLLITGEPVRSDALS